MNRLLLAILALFAGLAAQAVPAAARVCSGSETEIGAAQGVRSSVRPANNPASRIEAPAPRRDRAGRSTVKVRAGSLPVLFPPIYFGADRARE